MMIVLIWLSISNLRTCFLFTTAEVENFPPLVDPGSPDSRTNVTKNNIKIIGTTVFNRNNGLRLNNCEIRTAINNPIINPILPNKSVIGFCLDKFFSTRSTSRTAALAKNNDKTHRISAPNKKLVKRYSITHLVATKLSSTRTAGKLVLTYPDDNKY